MKTPTLKKALGWWWPNHEVHLLTWMEGASPPIINGRAAYQGRKQLAALDHCKRFGVAIDVGAHIGLWSYNLAPKFETVHAFEPVALHRECFKQNIKATNVVLHDCALGAVEGRVSIATTEGSSGDSKVVPGDDVQMRRLDDFEIRGVDFIKIDAEGFEENILLGGEATIRGFKPVIIVEQKRLMAKAFGLETLGAVRLLQAWGYKQSMELGGDFIMVPK